MMRFNVNTVSFFLIKPKLIVIFLILFIFLDVRALFFFLIRIFILMSAQFHEIEDNLPGMIANYPIC